MEAVKQHVLAPLNLWQFYVIDVKAAKESFAKAIASQQGQASSEAASQATDGDIKSIAAKLRASAVSNEMTLSDRYATTVDAKKALESDEDDEDDAEMNKLRAGILDECKLVLVVRSDLKMDKGKIAAQCSHATLACYKAMLKHNPSVLRQWERSGQAKVTLKCPSEAELMQLQSRAREAHLCAESIRDAYVH